MSALPKQQSLPFAENSQWLDTKQVAERLCIGERAAVNLATKHAASGLARREQPIGGGKAQWLIHVSADRRLRQAPSPEDSAQREALLRRFPEQAVHNALRRFRWLKEWERACERGSRGETERAIAGRVVSEARRVEGVDFKICDRSLRNWRQRFDAIGPDGRRMGIEGLLDRREFGKSVTADGESVARSSEAIALFNDLYRDNARPTMRECHAVTLHEARKQGWSWPATYAATHAWHVKHDDLSTTFLLREGLSAWSRKFLPHVEIDYSTLRPGEMFVADHHQCDFWVTHRKEQIRPWLTAVQDLRSRCIVGWHIGPAPHQDTIICTLRQAFRDWSIPERMKIDNGKDFKSKLLTGLTRTERERLKAEYGSDWRKIEARDANLVTCDDTKWEGILGELGIETHFAIPYCPWSKGTLERWFGTFESQLGKTMPTYCGNSALSKPECLDDIRRGYTSEQKRHLRKKHGKDWKRIAVLKFVDQSHVPTLDEARQEIAEYVALYHREEHNFDHESGVIPLRTWSTATTLRKADDGAFLLLMESRGVYRVTANGIGFKVGSAHHTYGDKCPALKRLIGRDVCATIDPDDISFCMAWTADEKGRRFIARLESNERIPPHTSVDAERDVIARKKREQSAMHKAGRSAARRHLSNSERFREYKREKLKELKKTGTYDVAADISVVRTGFETASKPIQHAPVSTPDGYVPFSKDEYADLDLSLIEPERASSVDDLDWLFETDEDDRRWANCLQNHNMYCDSDDPDPDCRFCDNNPPSDARKPLTLEDLLMPWQRRAEDSGTEALSDETEQAP